MAVTLDPEALTTVAAVRDGFSTSASDDEVTRKINHLTRRFMERTGRRWAWFTSAIVDGVDGSEYYPGTGTTWLFTKRRPITAVSNISLGLFTYSSSIPGWVGIDITDYQRTPEYDKAGKIYRVGLWVKVCPRVDRLTKRPDTRRSSLFDSIQLQYSAGYILPKYDGINDPIYNPTSAAANWPFEDYAIREVRNLLRKPLAGQIEQRTAGGWSTRYTDKTVIRPTEFETETEAWLDSETAAGALFR